MEASRRVRVSEGFICHLLVLSALPSYEHANRPGIPDKKRARRNILLNRMFVLVPQRWTLGAKFPKRKAHLHTPRHACDVRRVPAKCCSNTSVRAMRAFCGDRSPRVVRSSNAISESRWAQRRGNFLSRPKEPRSDGGWRHIEHYTHFVCGVPLKPAEK